MQTSSWKRLVQSGSWKSLVHEVHGSREEFCHGSNTGAL